MTRLQFNHSPLPRSGRHSPTPGGTRDAIAARAALHPGCEVRDTQLDAADLSYSVQDGVLRIDVRGPLDLRCVFRLLRIGQAVDDSISGCVLDLTDVDRVFDSGVAALILLSQELAFRGVKKIRIDGRTLESASLKPYLM